MKKNINKEENKIFRNNDIRGVINNNNDSRKNDGVEKTDSAVNEQHPNNKKVVNSSLDNFETDTSKELKASIRVGRKIIRIVIIPILFFSFFFLLIFIAVITVLYMLGIFALDSSSNSNESSSVAYDLSTYTSTTDNNDYWWPIGSRETTTVDGKLFATGDPGSNNLTAYFNGNDEVHKGRHFGIDIGAGINEENIIASKDGIVIYPYADSPINIGTCDYYGTKANCYGYGNYVKIKHNDGSVTLYGHMYANSITVRDGDIVKQGQVIGRSGSSGDSTGGHLHFEIRPNGEPVNPLDYVSANNPRPGKINGPIDVIN